jgi:hypothetical protein
VIRSVWTQSAQRPANVLAEVFEPTLDIIF